MGPRKLSSDGMDTHLIGGAQPASTSLAGDGTAKEPKQFQFLPWFSEDELTSLKLSRSSVDEDFLTAAMSMVGRIMLGGGDEEHDARLNSTSSDQTLTEESSEQNNLAWMMEDTFGLEAFVSEDSADSDSSVGSIVTGNGRSDEVILFRLHKEILSETQIKFVLFEGEVPSSFLEEPAIEKPVPFSRALEILGETSQNGSRLRSVLSQAMVELPWNAFFFEAPPVNKELIGRKFEFVCIDAPCLDSEAPADVYSFSDKFLLAPFSRVTTFSNLGSDALLVTPCPDGSRAPENYKHLASFVRGADPLQRELWWAECGRRALDRINALESRDDVTCGCPRAASMCAGFTCDWTLVPNTTETSSTARRSRGPNHRHQARCSVRK